IYHLINPPTPNLYTLSLHDALPIYAFEKLETLHRQTKTRWPLDNVRDYLLEVGRSVFLQRAEIGSAMTLMDLIERSVTLPLMFEDRKSTRLNSSHDQISYAVFCLKK